MRERRDPAVELMERLPLEDLATCGMVRMEVIRGIPMPKARRAFVQFFDVMQNVSTDSRLWEEATEIAWQLQRKGFAPPAQNLLIAASAKRIDAAVLTFDSHFEMIRLRTLFYD